MIEGMRSLPSSIVWNMEHLDGSHIGHFWSSLVPATIPHQAEDNDILSLVSVPQWAMLMVGQAFPHFCFWFLG